jgi:FKBP-type peptidyl-prolyl cis-trans isomerase
MGYLLNGLRLDTCNQRSGDVREMELRTPNDSHHHAWAALLTALAFLLANAASLTSVSNVRHNAALLVRMSMQINEIKLSITRHFPVSYEASRVGVASPVNERVSGVLAQGDATAVHKNAPVATSVRDRQPDQLQPNYEFDYGDYVNRLEGKRIEWTRARMLAFFEENAGRPGVIGLTQGVQYRVLRRGEGGSPQTADTVVFDFRVFLPDGTEIYSSFDQPEPPSFMFDDVVPGLKPALRQMRVGAQWEVYMPPALAFPGPARQFGRDRFEPLIYVVELKSIIDTSDLSDR